MRSFAYVINDKAGIHARPAGILVKEAQKYESQILVKKGDKSADAGKLMQMMSLGVKCGEEVTVEVSGADENQACEAMERILSEHL